MTSSVLAGGAWTSANIVLPYVLASIVSIVAARVLGPSEMGRQSFIAFMTLIATAVCAAGLPAALTRSAGESLGSGDAGALRGLVRAVWFVEAPLALLGMIVLLLLAALGAEPSTAWVFAAVTVLAGALGTVPLAALSGTLEWRGYSIAILSTNVAATTLTLGALAAGWGITGIVAVRLAQTAVVSLWSTRVLRSLLRKREPTAGSRKPELEKRMLRYAAGTSLTVLLTLVVYQRSELVFLNHFSTNAEIAHYAIASSALTILLAAPQSLGVALAPALSRLHGAGEVDRIRAGYSKAIRISTLATLPALGLAAIVGPPLLVLVYGESYRDVKTVFLMLLPSLLTVSLISASAAVLTAHRRMRAPFVALAAAAAVDVAVASLLVPRYGAPGAAAASVSALATAAVLQVAFAMRVVHTVDLDLRHMFRAAISTGAATAAGIALLYLLPPTIEIVVAAAAFGLVFAGLAAVLGIASAEDARWLADLAERAHPRAARLVAPVFHP
jgi:O-antigen/teichoic acid export membrane protein